MRAGRAEDAGDRRPFLQEDQHRFDAAAHLGQKAGRLQVVMHALRREQGMGLGHAVGKHLIDLREAAVELRAPEAELIRGGAVRWHGMAPQAKMASMA
jgi:hypothetical protein